MTKLTGLAYLLEHASFADKEAREKTEARIKPLLVHSTNYRNASDSSTRECAELAVCGIVDAINGDDFLRYAFGMEKGE